MLSTYNRIVNRRAHLHKGAAHLHKGAAHFSLYANHHSKSQHHEPSRDDHNKLLKSIVNDYGDGDDECHRDGCDDDWAHFVKYSNHYTKSSSLKLPGNSESCRATLEYSNHYSNSLSRQGRVC